MEALPNEILDLIFSHLTWTELNECSRVCWRWWNFLCLHERKVVVFDQCRLQDGSEPVSIFENSLGVYSSLRIGKVEGNAVGRLKDSVTDLDLKGSKLFLDVPMKEVRALSVTYSVEFSPNIYSSVETLRVFNLCGKPERFHEFIGFFPNLTSIFIETSSWIEAALWKFIAPFKDKVKGLPRDAIKLSNSRFCAYRDLDSFNPSRVLSDWRIDRIEVVAEKLLLERPEFVIQNVSEWETFREFLRMFPSVSLELKKPLEVDSEIQINKLRVSMSDELLGNFPKLLSCNEIEMSAYVFGLSNTSECFFGHKTLPSTVKTATLHLGSSKRCEKCWAYLARTFSKVTDLHYHGVFGSFVSQILARMKRLSKLKLTIGGFECAKKQLTDFKWSPIETLDSLTLHFHNELSSRDLHEILAAQKSLVSCEILGVGASPDILPSILQLKDVQTLVLMFKEDFNEFGPLGSLKMLKELSIVSDGPIVTGLSVESMKMDISETLKSLFTSCPLLRTISFRNQYFCNLTLNRLTDAKEGTAS